MLSSKEMDLTTRGQIMDEAVFISHCAITIGKGMNPTISPTQLRQYGRLGSLTLVWKPMLEKENSEFKHVKLAQFSLVGPDQDLPLWAM